ncbi:MAG: sialidase family protein, partial [Chloroflexi bacterium]|nr:sialidase family protein [Chloroflexota bacterium]
MIDESQHQTYSDDWRRTNPDLVFFLPPAPPEWQESVDHVLVSLTREGALLAIWTYCTQEHAADEAIMVRRSEDGGRTWTGPDVLAGQDRYPGQVASFGFPVMSQNGRIYCFYNRSTGLGDSYTNAFLECKVSDDDGRTWVDGNVQIPFRHTRFDLPDPKAGASCIVWQKPIRDRNNKHIVGITRW